MRLLVAISLLLLFCSSASVETRTTYSLHTHGWEIYYNDSLIYSTNPLIENKTWTTNRWKTHTLELDQNKVDSNDYIRINYRSDVIRQYYENILVKSPDDELLLSLENSKQLQVVKLKPLIKNNPILDLWFRQTHKLKNGSPDYEKSIPLRFLRININD